MSFNKNHPERQEDEVFLTNATRFTWRSINWQTKRLGIIAYSDDGNRIDSWRGSFPVFVKKEEVRQHNPLLLQRLEA